MVFQLTQYFGNVGVMHVGAGLENLSPLVLGPHHECIHWSLDMRLALAIALLGAHNFS